MFRLCIVLPGLLVLVAVLTTGIAQANVIVDGSFEFGGVRQPYTAGTYNGTAQKLGTDPPATGTGGWQVIDGAQPSYTFSVNAGDSFGGPDGSDQSVHIADAGTFGTIRQEFTTDVGGKYQLSVWGRLNCCGPSDVGIAWELGGTTNGQVTSAAFDETAWSDVFVWTEFTDTFVANDTTSYINLSNELSGMNFDLVSITLIPEPATISLILLSGLGLLPWRRRR